MACSETPTPTTNKNKCDTGCSYACPVPEHYTAPPIPPASAITAGVATGPIPIPLGLLTEVKLDGKGVFDELMSAARLHLQEEFNSNRIRGTDYSKVYVSTIQNVLQQSVHFLTAGIDAQAKLELVRYQALAAKLTAENLRFVEAKLVMENKLLEYNLNHAHLNAALTAGKIKESSATASLIKQRFTSEQAKTLDTVYQACSETEEDVAGSIKADKANKYANAQGFVDKREHDMAKLLVDFEISKMGVYDGDEHLDAANLEAGNVGQVVADITRKHTGVVMKKWAVPASGVGPPSESAQKGSLVSPALENAKVDQ